MGRGEVKRAELVSRPRFSPGRVTRRRPAESRLATRPGDRLCIAHLTGSTKMPAMRQKTVQLTGQPTGPHIIQRTGQRTG